MKGEEVRQRRRSALSRPYTRLSFAEEESFEFIQSVEDNRPKETKDHRLPSLFGRAVDLRYRPVDGPNEEK
jgi:hypothetical protein